MIDVEKFIISLRLNRHADGRLNPIRLADTVQEEAKIVEEAIKYSQLEQEPVAIYRAGQTKGEVYHVQFLKEMAADEVLLYAAPVQRTWVGLTKEERHKISLANKPYVADIMAAHEEELKRRNT
jgi:hypothetical protein